MAASLLRFVRGGLGKSFNSKLTKNPGFNFVHDVCCGASFKTPSCFATLNTTLPHFLPSNASALTFEVANANLSLMLIVYQCFQWFTCPVTHILLILFYVYLTGTVHSM